MYENNENLEQSFSKKAIWNPKYFLILTFLFSHIPVSIFYILNFHRLNRKSSRNKSILLIMSATALLVIGFYIIPSGSILKIFSLSISYGLGYYMKYSQEELYKEHIENGGKSAKYFLPVLLSLIFGAFLIFLIILTSSVPDKSIQFLDDEIYYTDSVSVEDVNLLGNLLIEIEYFYEDNVRASVKLDYDNYIYKIYFIIKEEYINNEKVINAFSELKNDIKKNLYPGHDVEIHFTDEYFKSIKVIK